jgi:ferritin
MIPSRIEDAINAQIGMEFAASLKYDSIASYFDFESLPRLAAFYYRQSTEERAHAHRFIKFLLDVGGRVKIPALAASPWDFGSGEAAAQAALESEQAVTASIDRLMNLAIEEKHHATVQMLQWFVNEQVEEVAQAELMLRIMKRAGENGLLMVEDYISQMPEGAEPQAG